MIFGPDDAPDVMVEGGYECPTCGGKASVNYEVTYPGITVLSACQCGTVFEIVKPA